MAIADEKYVSVTTPPPNGEAHRARVVPLSDGRLALLTADEAVADGDLVTVRADGSDVGELSGTALVVRSGRAFDEAVAKARKKYGWRARTSRVQAVVVVSSNGS